MNVPNHPSPPRRRGATPERRSSAQIIEHARELRAEALARIAATAFGALAGTVARAGVAARAGARRPASVNG